jgi:hypothetical protein
MAETANVLSLPTGKYPCTIDGKHSTIFRELGNGYILETSYNYQWTEIQEYSETGKLIGKEYERKRKDNGKYK